MKVYLASKKVRLANGDVAVAVREIDDLIDGLQFNKRHATTGCVVNDVNSEMGRGLPDPQYAREHKKQEHPALHHPQDLTPK